ncbi:MAG: hypothetical protein GTO14_14670 [Anaerolineales bacterium]|nr:hypothetical protein [Anaerolineales bacterium]
MGTRFQPPADHICLPRFDRPEEVHSGQTELSGEHDEFLLDLMGAVRSLVEAHALVERGYRLIANGGVNQEVPILHFHLISESEEVAISEYQPALLIKKYELRSRVENRY